MKQIGIALHNYHSVNDCFPPGLLNHWKYSVSPPTLNGANYDFSVHFRFLPSLEQQAIYNAGNMSVGIFNDPLSYINSTVARARLSVFLCLSDTPPTWVQETSPIVETVIAPGNNYYASLGSTMEWDGVDNPGGPPNGVFQYSYPISMRDITDGTSNTIAFAEWRVGDGIPPLILAHRRRILRAMARGRLREHSQGQHAGRSGGVLPRLGQRLIGSTDNRSRAGRQRCGLELVICQNC
jgi:hypothetical protein